MNTKYTEIFLFLSRLSRKNNKGFAMAFCLTVGVVLAATGTAMLVRSSNENKSVKAQENTARASAKGDVAVTRLVYFLNQPQHRELITKPLKDWKGFSGSHNDSNSGDDSEIQGLACDDDSGSGDSGSENADSQEVDTAMLENLLAENWIPIDSNNLSAGDYRLRDYCLVEPETIGGERKCPTNPTIPDDPDRVWLQVEARAVNHGTDDLKTNNSVRAVEAMIPINKFPEEPSDLPGLWVSDTSNGSGGDEDNSKQSSGDNKPINAVTWIDCSQKSEWNSNDSYVNDSKLDLSPIVMGSTSITPPDEVKRVKDDLPSIPSIPSSGVYDLGSLDVSDCYITLPRVSGNSWGGESGKGCEDINNTTDDDPDANGIYYYKFTGDDSIKLSNAQIRINPPENTKVVIYIDGGITMSGKGKPHGGPATCQGASEDIATYIGHPDAPSKLEIYSDSDDKPIDISDTTMISAFVHAPKTELKISQAQVRGGAWVKKMDASNSGGGSGCDRSIKQMDVGKTLVTGGESGESESKQTLGSIIGYRSLEAN